MKELLISWKQDVSIKEFLAKGGCCWWWPLEWRTLGMEDRNQNERAWSWNVEGKGKRGQDKS